MFTLILKPILHILHIYWPILALGFNSILVALWSVATYAQQSSDYTDPQYPAPHPWYLVYSCNVAYEQKNVKNCQMAKGSFAVAVIML